MAAHIVSIRSRWVGKSGPGPFPGSDSDEFDGKAWARSGRVPGGTRELLRSQCGDLQPDDSASAPDSSIGAEEIMVPRTVAFRLTNPVVVHGYSPGAAPAHLPPSVGHDTSYTGPGCLAAWRGGRCCFCNAPVAASACGPSPTLRCRRTCRTIGTV